MRGKGTQGSRRLKAESRPEQEKVKRSGRGNKGDE